MSGHNLLDFVKKCAPPAPTSGADSIEVEPAQHRLYLRMTLEERLQHGSLALSFIVLVITGLHAPLPRLLVGRLDPEPSATTPSTSGASSTGSPRS